MSKKLVRKTSNKMIAGVCSGIADYLGIDTTIIRVLTILLSIFFGEVFHGLIIYCVAAIVIPDENETNLNTPNKY